MRLGEATVGLAMQANGLWLAAEGIDMFVHTKSDGVGNLVAGSLFLAIGITIATKYGKDVFKDWQQYIQTRNNVNRLEARATDLRAQVI